ncbi:MAG: hypothetical protein K1060chlam3_00754 [Candidatus Anoxychlamydiales bacterium]|nr:hypothetical protein [Candidatus Anoxychlamydiales bacterium]
MSTLSDISSTDSRVFASSSISIASVERAKTSANLVDQKFKLFNLTTAKNLAIKVVKIAAIILATSAVLHILSIGMIQASTLLSTKSTTYPLSKLSSFLMHGGLKIQKLAEVLFLSVSVPTYMIFYKIPKHLIQKIPALIRTLNTYILKFIDFSMKHVIKPLIKQLTKVIDFLKLHVMSLIKKIFKVINFIGEKIIKPILTWTWKIISKVASTIYNKVIYPLLDLTRNAFVWIGNNIIKPFARWSYRVISTALSNLYDKVIYPLLELTRNTFVWIGKNIIEPSARWIFKTVSTTLSNLYNKVIYPLLKLTKDCFVWLGNNIIKPLAKWSFKITSKACSSIYRNLIHPVAHKCFLVLNYIAQKTAKFTTFLYKKTIEPLATITIKAIGKIIEKIVEATNRIITIATITI